MKISVLTAPNLQVALEQIASASSETECAQALSAAASMVQSAVLTGQSPDSVREALEAGEQFGMTQLGAVIDRAVNFHTLESGGSLGLWLMPVTISSDATLPSSIALETASLNPMKMGACLLEQLELSPGKTGGDRAGWTVVIPALFSESNIRSTDIGQLISLPQQARDFVRGTRKELTFSGGSNLTASAAGVTLYYLPVVAFAPEGTMPALPLSSAKTNTRLTQWAAETFKALNISDVAVQPGPAPQPFSLALRTGGRLRLEVSLRQMMTQVCAHSGVEVNGLAALVAPYAIRQTDGTLMVGVTLVSRLTENVVSTLTLPVISDDGHDEVALAIHVLKALGMECIQDIPTPINTIACQHCGNMQFAVPSNIINTTTGTEQGTCVH